MVSNDSVLPIAQLYTFQVPKMCTAGQRESLSVIGLKPFLLSILLFLHLPKMTYPSKAIITMMMRITMYMMHRCREICLNTFPTFMWSRNNTDESYRWIRINRSAYFQLLPRGVGYPVHNQGVSKAQTTKSTFSLEPFGDILSNFEWFLCNPSPL